MGLLAGLPQAERFGLTVLPDGGRMHAPLKVLVAVRDRFEAVFLSLLERLFMLPWLADQVSGLPRLGHGFLRWAATALALFVLLALAGLLIVGVSRLLTGALDRVPLLGFSHRLAGLLAGLVTGLLWANVILLLTGLSAPFIPACFEQLGRSRLAEHLYLIPHLF